MDIGYAQKGMTFFVKGNYLGSSEKYKCLLCSNIPWLQQEVNIARLIVQVIFFS